MNNTPPKISESTELTLDIKTIAIIIAGAIAITTAYFTLQNDINNNDEKSSDSLTKIEFNISQEAVKQIVRETQTMMHGGHTTMYQMLIDEFRSELKETKKEIIDEMKDQARDMKRK